MYQHQPLSANAAAVGDGFIAQDMWFQNTAGPEKHQAVALRVGADQSVINRCRIDAYQDTLYTHSNRQFYRDSYITGRLHFGDVGMSVCVSPRYLSLKFLTHFHTLLQVP